MMLKNLFAIVLFAILFKVSTSVEYRTDDYTLIDYNDLNKLMADLKRTRFNDTLFKIKDVFEEYPTIPKLHCPNEKASTKQCKSYLIEVANFEKGKAYVEKLPTVFIVAGFHGNEVTGTNAVYQFMKVLRDYYDKNSDLYALLQNVRLLILPTANVNGFDNNKREERINGQTHDPNRDFPYDVDKKGHCFKTTTAMIIDSIFRDNMIVGSLTFHGGENSITYPWGNYAHSKRPKSGDHIAFSEVAKVLQNVSGDNPKLDIEKYKTGLLHDVVYDVNGGFEDWAYGASWDGRNVSKTCAANVGFSPLVTKRSIEYDKETNRAFVYLVEAGDDKTPSEGTLGNEIAIFRPHSDEAVWGNVTRNIVLFMKFTEIVQPYAIIKEVKYTDKLIVDMAVRGCVTVQGIDIPKFKHGLIRNYSTEKNEHSFVFTLPDVGSYIPELTIKYHCDGKWANGTLNHSPETHLVKMRTDPHYIAHHHNYTLTSQKTIEAKLLNIKTTVLDEALIHMQPRNMFAMSYYTTYRAKINDHYMLFNYSEGFLTAEMDNERPTFFDIVVEEYGTIGCCNQKTNGDSPYLKMKSDDVVEISSQVFLELLGRAVVFKDSYTKEVLHTSHIELINGDEYSSLLIPPNGLTCASGDIEDYYYVTVKYHESKQLRVEVLTGYQGAMRFKLENIEDSLFKDPSFESSEPNVSNHFSILDIKKTNMLRVRGSPFEILDTSGNVLFDCTLNMLNPYYSEIDNLNFDVMRHAAAVQARKPKNTVEKGLLILLILLFVIIAAIIIYLNKRNASLGQTSSKNVNIDLQETKNIEYL